MTLHLIVTRSVRTGSLSGVIDAHPEQLSDFRGPDGAPHERVAIVPLPVAAAAPALYEACKAALERLGGMNEAQGVIDELQAALALAEGGA